MLKMHYVCERSVFFTNWFDYFKLETVSAIRCNSFSSFEVQHDTLHQVHVSLRQKKMWMTNSAVLYLYSRALWHDDWQMFLQRSVFLFHIISTISGTSDLHLPTRQAVKSVKCVFWHDTYLQGNDLLVTKCTAFERIVQLSLGWYNCFFQTIIVAKPVRCEFGTQCRPCCRDT